MSLLFYVSFLVRNKSMCNRIRLKPEICGERLREVWSHKAMWRCLWATRTRHSSESHLTGEEILERSTSKWADTKLCGPMVLSLLTRSQLYYSPLYGRPVWPLACSSWAERKPHQCPQFSVQTPWPASWSQNVTGQTAKPTSYVISSSWPSSSDKACVRTDGSRGIMVREYLGEV